MSWFRQEAAFFQNPNVVLAGWHGSIVFLIACHMAKLYEWRDGDIPKPHFTPALIRRFSGAPEACHSDADIEEGIASCVRAELLEEDETHYHIRSWRKFQLDPTAAKRQAKSRAKKKASRNVTVTNRESRHRTGQTDGTEQTEQTDRASAPDLPASASLHSPEPERNGRPSNLHPGQKLSPKAKIAVGAILDRLCKNAAGPEWQARALEQRQAWRNDLLPDAIGSLLLDEFKSKFAGSIGKAYQKEGVGQR